MAIAERERNRRKFVAMLEENSISKAQAADMLHSSLPRITSWCRIEGAAGANPVPMWAIELLTFKVAAMVAVAKNARKNGAV